MFIAKNIGISIKCAPQTVYDYVRIPINLPYWASGLSDSKIEKIDGKWFANSPMGKVEVKFAEKNDFGVLDHEVIMTTGEKFYNPLRVVKNEEGSEVIFTLYRQPKMSDEDFNKDEQNISKDLKKLKEILEGLKS